jgi:hypothetical protein
MKKIIHVNRHNIAANKANADTEKPVFTVKTYKENHVGNRVVLRSKNGGVLATFVYRPEKPLPCGAVAWLETHQDTDVEVGPDGLVVTV